MKLFFKPISALSLVLLPFKLLLDQLTVLFTVIFFIYGSPTKAKRIKGGVARCVWLKKPKQELVEVLPDEEDCEIPF